MSGTLGDVLQTGTHSARPAATAVGAGTLYSCSTHGLVYQSNGTTWSTWATAGSASTGITAKKVAVESGTGTTGVATFGSAPASTSLLFALIATVVSTAQTVSSITQTNVTWTLVHAKANGTSANVELWKGVPSGTPGTTVTVNFTGSTNAHAVSVIEWAGPLAGTLDTSADASGTGTSQGTGVITPAAGALTFALMAVASGSGAMAINSGGPWIVVTTLGTGGQYAALAYTAQAGGGTIYAFAPVQTSAAWANTIVSVV